MKKAMSLILAIMMVFALSTTAFAATDIVGTVNGSTANDYTEGVTEGMFAANNPTANVNITATAGDVESRYAVDIEYTNVELSITGSKMVWDVNALKYVPKDGGDVAEDQEFAITVTNRSDKPVVLTAKIAEVADMVPTALALDIAAGKGTYTSADKTYVYKIPGNLAGTDLADVEKDTFKLTASGDWQAIADFYFEKFNGNVGNINALIATLNVTISLPTT